MQIQVICGGIVVCNNWDDKSNIIIFSTFSLDLDS
jgi:hypothetical protein